jgi:hypothetical protein
MTIKLNKGILKKEAGNAIDKLISDGNSITSLGDWRDYEKVSMWKADVGFEIKRLFLNHQDILASFFEKGGFESPDSPLSTLSIADIEPGESNKISRRNRDLIHYQIKELCDIKNQIQEEETKTQVSSNIFSIQLKKCKLHINRNTGDVELNGIKNNFNPESQEFKVLCKLAISKDYKATYEDLLGNNPTKPNKRNLSFTIRNIKETLDILPKRTAKNKDIIGNIKNHGYRLLA